MKLYFSFYNITFVVYIKLQLIIIDVYLVLISLKNL